MIGEAPDGRPAIAPAVAPMQKPSRLFWADNLRLATVALVIAHHSVEPYATSNSAYTRLPDAPVPGLWSFLWVNAAFFMGLLFLLAGMFTPASVDKKGVRAYVRDRLVRLGVPLLFGFLALIPLEDWFFHLAYRSWPAVGYGDYFVHYFLGIGGKPIGWIGRWPDANFGHLWFIQHLLVYALLYGVWRALAGNIGPTPVLRAPGHVAIAAYLIGLTLATYAIRRWYPQDAWIGFLHFIQMEPAHFPQYLSLFVIGLVAGRNDWAAAMPTRRALPWLAVAIGCAVACYVLVGSGIVRRLDSRDLFVCAWEATICTGLCVGLPVAFREIANAQNSTLKILSANSYAAYIFHFPIVMALQWLLIGAPLPIGARIGITIAGSIVLTFMATQLLILRIPGARRILIA